MDFSRAQDRLFSLAASLMVTASVLATAPAPVISAASGPQPQALINALTGLRAAGFRLDPRLVLSAPASTPAAAVPSAPPDQAGPKLTAEQVKRILAFSAAQGHEQLMDKRLTDALGLTSGSGTLTLHEIGLELPSKEVVGFYALPDGGYLLASVRNGVNYGYRTDKDFNLIAAASRIEGAPALVIPRAEAQKGLDTALTTWADVSKLLPPAA